MMRRAVRSLVQCVVVVLSFGAGIASAILAVRAVPPFEIAPRVTEGTPVQLVVFGSTFLVVVAFSITVGLQKPIPDRLGRRFELAPQFFGVHPFRISSMMRWRNSGGYGRWLFGIVDTPFRPNHGVSTKPGQLHR